jgi:hypothetical protein
MTTTATTEFGLFSFKYFSSFFAPATCKPIFNIRTSEAGAKDEFYIRQGVSS